MPPVDLVRNVLAIIAGLNDTGAMGNMQTTCFMVANSIIDVNDFASLETPYASEMVKQYQQRVHATGAIGITVQNRLTGLIWWARDRCRRSLPIDTAGLNTDILEAAQKDVAAGDTVTALEKFNPKQEFSSWDDIVTEALLDQCMGAHKRQLVM